MNAEELKLPAKMTRHDLGDDLTARLFSNEVLILDSLAGHTVALSRTSSLPKLLQLLSELGWLDPRSSAGRAPRPETSEVAGSSPAGGASPKVSLGAVRCRGSLVLGTACGRCPGCREDLDHLLQGKQVVLLRANPEELGLLRQNLRHSGTAGDYLTTYPDQAWDALQYLAWPKAQAQQRGLDLYLWQPEQQVAAPPNLATLMIQACTMVEKLREQQRLGGAALVEELLDLAELVCDLVGYCAVLR